MECGKIGMNFYNENNTKTAAWLRELIKADLIAPGVVDERSLQRSLENRLRLRFNGDGGMGQHWILRESTTPALRRFCVLMRLAPHTKGKGFTGWPMATRLLERGTPWTVISAIYCLAMGFPSSWNEVRLRATATRLYQSPARNSSKPT